jgi:hypothetical protein
MNEPIHMNCSLNVTNDLQIWRLETTSIYHLTVYGSGVQVLVMWVLWFSLSHTCSQVLTGASVKSD